MCKDDGIRNTEIGGIGTRKWNQKEKSKGTELKRVLQKLSFRAISNLFQSPLSDGAVAQKMITVGGNWGAAAATKTNTCGFSPQLETFMMNYYNNYKRIISFLNGLRLGWQDWSVSQVTLPWNLITWVVFPEDIDDGDWPLASTHGL